MTTEEMPEPAEEPVVPPEQEEPTEAPAETPSEPAPDMPAPSEEENLRAAFEKGASNRGE